MALMSMKNSNDTIGNRTRDLPACSAVPQPTALPRAPIIRYIWERKFADEIADPVFSEDDYKYRAINAV